GDHRRDVGQRLLLGAPHLGTELDGDRVGADVLPDGCAHVGLYARPHGTCRCRQVDLQRDGHTGDVHRFDHAERDEVLMQFRVVHAATGLHHCFVRQLHMLSAYQRAQPATPLRETEAIIRHVSDVSRYERGEPYSTHRDAVTYRGLDPLTGLDVLIY